MSPCDGQFLAMRDMMILRVKKTLASKQYEHCFYSYAVYDRDRD